MDKAGTGICDAAYRREDTFPGMVWQESWKLRPGVVMKRPVKAHVMEKTG